MDNELFLKENSIDGGFLQSPDWQKFQESVGKETLSFEQENFYLKAFRHTLPIAGDYFFVPRGPIFSKNISNEELRGVMEKIIGGCEVKKAGWLRIEPQSQENFEKIKDVLGGKWYIEKSRKNHEPAQTIMLDLNKSEEEILSQMKPKTRYNIRLSGKKGVEIEVSRKPSEDIEIFYEISKETAKRDQISIHPFEYYRKMVTEIGNDKIKLYLAKHEGRVVSAIIVSFFGGVATYLHGASSNEHRNVMANYALQWESIKYAKKIGCKKYDFGGVMVENSKFEIRNSKQLQKNKNETQNIKWAGITRFKISFAPKEKIVDFPGCWDIVINKRRYFIYRFLQKIKDATRN